MKTYIGTPGDPPTVTVTSGKGKPRKLIFPDAMTPKVIAWGTAAIECSWLAYAILLSVLDSPERARALHSRFKWRVVSTLWKADQPWVMTKDQVLAIVADIQKVEIDTAQSVRMAKLEPTPIVSDRGADIEWSKNPQLVDNLAKGRKASEQRSGDDQQGKAGRRDADRSKGRPRPRAKVSRRRKA